MPILMGYSMVDWLNILLVAVFVKWNLKKLR